MKYKIQSFLNRHPVLYNAMLALLTLVTLLGSFYLLQFSTFGLGVADLFLPFFSSILGILNFLTLGILFVFLFILCNRVWLSCLLHTLICGIISVINFYVIQFHSMPLSFLVLRNFKTALNVASSYSFDITPTVKQLLLVMALLSCMALIGGLFSGTRRPAKKWNWLRNLILIAVSGAVFYTGYLGPNPIKPANTLGWSWEESYGQYGYVVCTVDSFFRLSNAITKPEGYSQELVDTLSAPEAAAPSGEAATPDIILILNESFYDLRQVTDPKTDVPYLQNIDAMDNLLRGYAVVPSSGGTNGSEYELLTSNSLQLMPGITPFNTLPLQGANSIVSHLNALGYHTLGTHSEPSLNYSRGIGYPALGFQTIYFEESYQDVEFYKTRVFESDESVYRNLIRWYGEAPEDMPRFQYVLTIQNHGAWERNEPEDDLVHTGRDYGQHTQSVNEFLTCIYQSDAAFKDLTDYFTSVDRPVIVCMMGDHRPTFASDIADADFSQESLDIRLRKVPLLIWANYPLEQQELGTMSMNMVVPTLLDIANVELSPYYRYMLELKEQVPVLSSIDVYYDAQGNRYSYSSDDDSPYQEPVNNYFCLEYQNVATDHNRDFYRPDSP